MITITENELFRFKKMEENDTKWQKKKMLKFVEEKHVGQIRKGRAGKWSLDYWCYLRSIVLNILSKFNVLLYVLCARNPSCTKIVYFACCFAEYEPSLSSVKDITNRYFTLSGIFIKFEALEFLERAKR